MNRTRLTLTSTALITALLLGGCAEDVSKDRKIRNKGSDNIVETVQCPASVLPYDEPEHVIFFREYSNMAWVHEHSGYCITNKGNVYIEEITNGSISDEPLDKFDLLIANTEPIATIDIDYLSDIYSLASEIDPDATFETTHVGYDMGQANFVFVNEDSKEVIYGTQGCSEGYVDNIPKKLKTLWDDWYNHATAADGLSYTVYTTELPFASICCEVTDPTIEGCYILDSYEELSALFKSGGVTIEDDALETFNEKSDLVTDGNFRLFVQIQVTDAHHKNAFLMNENEGICFFTDSDGESSTEPYVTLIMVSTEKGIDFCDQNGNKWERLS